MKNFAKHLTHAFQRWNLPILHRSRGVGDRAVRSQRPSTVWRQLYRGHCYRFHRRGSPAASIHVVDDATAVAVDTQSNGVGFYQVLGIFTGHTPLQFLRRA